MENIFFKIKLFWCIPWIPRFKDFFPFSFHFSLQWHLESLGSNICWCQHSAYHILKLIFKNTTILICIKCCSMNLCFNLQLNLKNIRSYLSESWFIKPQLMVGQGKKAAGHVGCQFTVVHLETGTSNQWFWNLSLYCCLLCG